MRDRGRGDEKEDHAEKTVHLNVLFQRELRGFRSVRKHVAYNVSYASPLARTRFQFLLESSLALAIWLFNCLFTGTRSKYWRLQEMHFCVIVHVANKLRKKRFLFIQYSVAQVTYLQVTLSLVARSIARVNENNKLCVFLSQYFLDAIRIALNVITQKIQ